MKAYQALYNPCTWESSYGTLSTHLSKEGAKKAMKAHRAKEKQQFDKMFKGKEKEYPGMKFGQHEAWCINEIEILP